MYQRAVAALRSRRQSNGELESLRQFVERVAREEETMRHGYWYRRALWATFALGAIAWIASGFYPWVGVGVLALMAVVALVMPDR